MLKHALVMVPMLAVHALSKPFRAVSYAFVKGTRAPSCKRAEWKPIGVQFNAAQYS